MVNLKRRKMIKKVSLVILGVILFRFTSITDLFKKKDNNIYSKDGKLMVSING